MLCGLFGVCSAGVRPWTGCNLLWTSNRNLQARFAHRAPVKNVKGRFWDTTPAQKEGGKKPLRQGVCFPNIYTNTDERDRVLRMFGPGPAGERPLGYYLFQSLFHPDKSDEVDHMPTEAAVSRSQLVRKLFSFF